MIKMLHMLYSIKNFPRYDITTCGRVWSVVSNKFLKATLAKNGYYYHSLMKNGKRYYRPIHRLLLETFVGKCPKGMECCHNNGVKTDNRLENLRWDTTKNNSADSKVHGTRIVGESKHNAKLTERDVRTIIYTWRTNLFTQQKIADMYNMSVSHINGIIHKKYWKHLWEK